jgi:Uma2 family endonuclease
MTVENVLVTGSIVATLTRSDVFPDGLLHSPALLSSGDRMWQAEFHRRYEQYPDDVKFELVNGMVFMASPQRLPHCTCEVQLSTLLGLYSSATPGVQPAHNQTVILGEASEPQPDFLLRVLPEYGGRTKTDDDYVCGGPELVIEVAHSTAAIDLHDKKDDYQRHGVSEYLVVCLEEPRLYWFDLAGGRSRNAPADGILRSKTFPGLWIDTRALFRGDLKRLMRVIKQGLSSPEHARFVRRLEKAARKGEQEEPKVGKKTKAGG